MGKRSGVVLLAAVAVAALVAGCGGGEGSDRMARATSKPPQVAATFRICKPGPRGGGYRVRAFEISCEKVRRILPRMFKSATLVTRRERERVYRNDDSWTCLSQGQPRRFGFTLVLCVRGSQAILYRFA